jgi:hypothetical protein
MAQLVDLALIDITNAPKWPRIISGSKPAASATSKRIKAPRR